MTESKISSADIPDYEIRNTQERLASYALMAGISTTVGKAIEQGLAGRDIVSELRLHADNLEANSTRQVIKGK